MKRLYPYPSIFELQERDFIAGEYIRQAQARKRRNFAHKWLKVTLFLVSLVIASRWF